MISFHYLLQNYINFEDTIHSYKCYHKHLHNIKKNIISIPTSY